PSPTREQSERQARWRIPTGIAGRGEDRPGRALVRLPLHLDGVWGAADELDHRLRVGGVGRERAGEAAALFPADDLSRAKRAATDENPDVLVDASGGGPQVGVGAKQGRAGRARRVVRGGQPAGAVPVLQGG